MGGRLQAWAMVVVRFGCLTAGVVVLFAIVFAVTGKAPAALVVLPAAGFPQALPGDVRVLRWDERTAVVTSDENGYVRRLYAAGAWLVLPYRTAGCMDLQSSPNSGSGA